MKIFEAHKRASFAEKLFASVGFDFNAALATNNEASLRAHIAASPAPEIGALFTAAGLDAAALVAAGPDALKLHLESLDNSEELAVALQENEKLAADVTKLDGEVHTLSDIVQHVTTAIALPMAKDAKAEDVKAAFEAHVSKQTTLALAKTGHPPAHVPVAAEPNAGPKTDAELAKEYQGMKGCRAGNWA